MPNCGNVTRFELGNGVVNRSKDIPRGATNKLRGRFQADVVMKRTACENHRTRCEPLRRSRPPERASSPCYREKCRRR